MTYEDYQRLPGLKGFRRKRAWCI